MGRYILELNNGLPILRGLDSVAGDLYFYHFGADPTQLQSVVDAGGTLHGYTGSQYTSSTATDITEIYLPTSVLDEVIATETISFDAITIPATTAFRTGGEPAATLTSLAPADHITFSSIRVYSSSDNISSYNYNGSSTPLEDDPLSLGIASINYYPAAPALPLAYEYFDSFLDTPSMTTSIGIIDAARSLDLELQNAGEGSDFYYAMALDESYGMEANSMYLTDPVTGESNWVIVNFASSITAAISTFEDTSQITAKIIDVGRYDGALTTIGEIQALGQNLYGDPSPSEADTVALFSQFSTIDEIVELSSVINIADVYTELGYDPGAVAQSKIVNIYNNNNEIVKVHTIAGDLEATNALIGSIKLLDPDASLGVMIEDADAAIDFMNVTANTIELYDLGPGTVVDLSGAQFRSSQIVDINSIGEFLITQSETNSDQAQHVNINFAAATLTLKGDFSSGHMPTVTNAAGGTLKLEGSASDETIFGSVGDDVIIGGHGDDMLSGGADGDDVFIFTTDGTVGDGNDYIYAVDSSDTLVFNNIGGESIVTLNEDKTSSTLSEWKASAGSSDGTTFYRDGDTYHYTGGTVTVGQPAGMITGEQTKFEIVELTEERAGDILTYAIRVKDEYKSEDFTSIDLGVSWQEDEFDYVETSLQFSELSSYYGTFSAVNQTDNKVLVSLSSIDLNTPVSQIDPANTISYDYASYTKRHSDLSLQDPALTYSEFDESYEQDYVAKFLVKRIDAEPGINQLDLTYSDHSIFQGMNIDGTSNISDNRPDEAFFKFDYDKDTVNVSLKNQANKGVPGAELFFSSETVTDGLSLVPIFKYEDLVKYQVVLNVSDPVLTYEPAKAAHSGSLYVTGAEIFSDTFALATGLTAAGWDSFTTFPSVNYTIGTDTDNLDGTDPSPLSFLDEIDSIIESTATGADPDFSVVKTANSVTFDINGHAFDMVAGGRYAVAEFWARNDATGIDYAYRNNADTEFSNLINMKSVALGSDGSLTKVLNDGSDIAILGNAIYENPFSNLRSITGRDALDALRVSVDNPSDPDFSNSEYIASDFNNDGVVSALDAYDILLTSVMKTPVSFNSYPTWKYVQDLDYSLGKIAEYESLYPFDNNGLKELGIGLFYDPFIDGFVGEPTSINATAVLGGDVNYDFVPIPYGDDPLIKWYEGFINLGTNVDAVPISGSGTSENGEFGGQASGGSLNPIIKPTTIITGGDNSESINIPGAKLIADQDDVSVDTTATADVASGMITDYQVAGAAVTLDYQTAGSVAVALASSGATAATDDIVLGYSDGTNTYIYHVNDFETSGDNVFELKAIYSIEGIATGISTGGNASSIVYIDPTINSQASGSTISINSNSQNLDLSGSATVPDTVSVSGTYFGSTAPNISGFVTTEDTLLISKSDLDTAIGAPAPGSIIFEVHDIDDTANNASGQNGTFILQTLSTSNYALTLDVNGDTEQRADNSVFNNVDDIIIAYLDSPIVAGDISIIA